LRIARFVFCLVLFICLVQATSAYTVKTVAISPSSTPQAGDVVVLTTTIAFQGPLGKSFDPDHDLLFSTDLDSPAWTFGLSRDGVADPAIAAEGTTARLDGVSIACGSGTTLVCTVSVEGMAPPDVGDPEISAIAIQELDSDGTPIGGGGYEKTIEVDTAATLDARIQEQEATLKTLRLLIESKARAGVDTSAAKAKYQAAGEALAVARTASVSSASTAYADLARARKYTSEIGPLLDIAVDDFNREAVMTTPVTTTVTTMALTTGPTTVPATMTTAIPGTLSPETTVSSPATISPFQPVVDETSASTTPSVTAIPDEQNGTLEKPNNNNKMDQQNALLDRIVDFLESLFGWTPEPLS
jgi:hypothetical protein